MGEILLYRQVARKVASRGVPQQIMKREVMNLTFRGSCIMIYSYNKSQQGAQFLKFI